MSPLLPSAARLPSRAGPTHCRTSVSSRQCRNETLRCKNASSQAPISSSNSSPFSLSYLNLCTLTHVNAQVCYACPTLRHQCAQGRSVFFSTRFFIGLYRSGCAFTAGEPTLAVLVKQYLVTLNRGRDDSGVCVPILDVMNDSPLLIRWTILGR